MRAEQIQTAVDKIVAALGPSDPRTLEVEKDRSADAIGALVHGVLSDGAMEGRSISLALWLARIFPSPILMKDIINVLRDRPDVAMLAGAALARVAGENDLSEVGQILLAPTAAVECRCGAARALAKWRDKRVDALLKTALRLEPRNESVLREVIQALAWADIRGYAENSADDIRSFLGSEFADVRYSALVALGNLHATNASAEVAALLDDPGVTSTGESVKVEAQRVATKLNAGPRPG